MRIMLHSNSPATPSGYGIQARLLGRQLLAAGHQVGVSAFNQPMGMVMEWEGMTIMPGGQLRFGVDTIIPHAVHYRADLVISLMDFWQLAPIAEQLQGLNLAAMVPVDSDPLGFMDRGTLLASKARPLAMSRFALRMLEEAGHPDVVYLPHAVDTIAYRPLEDEERLEYRRGMGLDGRFVVGMVAANNDHLRKGFPEQFEAFRRLHKEHPEALLLVHTMSKSQQGLDLGRMAHAMGLDPTSYRFSDTYAQTSGIFDQAMMRDFYGVLDVLSLCSYAEGFGVPALEAQACGTPVVSTRGSAMDETRGPGWPVASQPFWNHMHEAWWRRPDIASIHAAYRKAYKWASTKRKDARQFAEMYDIGRVFEEHWVPYLGQVEERLGAAADPKREESEAQALEAQAQGWGR